MKKRKVLRRVFNFSGGKTSAYMVIRHYRPGDLVVFCDTGREAPGTYKFIDDFEKYEGIPVIKIRYRDAARPFNAMLERYDHKTIPNHYKKICTRELKIRTCKRYLKSIGIKSFYNFIGFRYDEPDRVIGRKKEFIKVVDVFPLYDDRIQKENIIQYWDGNPYNLEIPPILGNCTLCFEKGKAAVIAILTVMPELAQEWIHDEDESERKWPGKGRTYFKNTTYRQLLEIAKKSNKRYDLLSIQPAFKCPCTA